jgi:Sec-independent protein translocase protein TatA
MRNISINQFIIIIFLGVLLFSDFSKIIKYFRDLIKSTKIYKNLKKK